MAEDVEKVNPDLVVRDKEGKPYSVRYEAVNAMLLNEFLKEHRTVQELEANALRASEKQDCSAYCAAERTVSAQLAEGERHQLEASKPAPHLVNNP